MVLLENNILKISGKICHLMPLSDWHIGSHACNMVLIKKIVSYVKNTENCYAFILGDLIDMISYHSKGLMHTQKFFATDQVKIVLGLLEEIKDKILFAVTGNHENRSVKDSALDLMDLICNRLDIEYRQFDSHFAIQLENNAPYVRCYAVHGVGGGSSAGAKINRIIQIHFRSPMADLIFMGHVHDPACTEKLIPYIGSKGQIMEKIQYFVNAGMALESSSGYAAQNCFPPVPIGTNVVHIKRGNKTNNISVERFR